MTIQRCPLANEGQRRLVGIPAIALCLLLGLADSSFAQSEVGRVTLMSGAPRMVGESIRPLQAILSGRTLETGDGDAAGLLVEDVVFHIGANSKVTVYDEPGGKRFAIEQGFVVLYADAATSTAAIVETPFGRLNFTPGLLGEGDSGWYSVRHDPQQVNVRPAVSTFTAMEGPVEVVGTAPQAGPHMLKSGQRWRIVQGQVPGPPEVGDGRLEAEALRDLLHRGAAEFIHVQPDDITQLALGDLQTGGVGAEEVIFNDGQFIFDVNAANQGRSPVPFLPIFPEPVVQAQEDIVMAFGAPAIIAAGTPALANAQFVRYSPPPPDASFNDFLTSVDGSPAFQPLYFTEFANGGFSYIQLAGANVALADNNGETFLAADAGDTSGWATFTPVLAFGDSNFDPQSRLATLVSEGFSAIARGEHQAGGGNIGGDGVDPKSGFAEVTPGSIGLNANPPAGYPQLDAAADTTGLAVGGGVAGIQIAALGEGLDPQRLDQAGPQLVFLSSGNTDANGNAFNFDGNAIVPTDLNLPADRQVLVDNSGSAAVATPLASDPSSTVGIQFAGTGETIAIIHHTGLNNPDVGSTVQSDNFEVVRGDRASIVRWRDGRRVVGDDGVLLEFEDIGGDPALRNELFGLLCNEVNSLVPGNTQTLCGPAISQPGMANARLLRRARGSLVRADRSAVRRNVEVRGIHTRATMRSLKSANLKPAGGRLLVGQGASSHRHLGRVSASR